MHEDREASVDRFRRRVERTPDATLRRNLREGVYGPPGSDQRAVAEEALDLRVVERAKSLQVVTESQLEELTEATERARKTARGAVVLAALAMIAGLIALLGAVG